MKAFPRLRPARRPGRRSPLFGRPQFGRQAQPLGHARPIDGVGAGEMGDLTQLDTLLGVIVVAEAVVMTVGGTGDRQRRLFNSLILFRN